MNISEVLKLPTGTIVDHVFGEVVSVGPYEQKQRPDSEVYKVQPFIIESATGERLNGTIFDHYPLDEHLNKILYFCSMKSRNGRFGGVTTFQMERESVFSKQRSPVTIRVSKAGAIHTPDSFAGLKRKPETK